MPEQIGVFLLFIAFVVFNLIAGAVNRRRQREAKEGQQPRALPPRAVIRPPDVEVSPPAPIVTRTFRPLMRRRHPLELRRVGLRRAIVLMTVLGPPRALEHEAKEGSGQR